MLLIVAQMTNPDRRTAATVQVQHSFEENNLQVIEIRAQITSDGNKEGWIWLKEMWQIYDLK